MKQFPPEQFRVNTPMMPSSRDSGNNGMFKIPHFKIADYFFNCAISDGMGWEHVSITLGARHRNVDRCPTWEEMCYIKDMFWEKDECVVQYHPPESEYVSSHPYCLHLWKPTDATMPTPPSMLVGIQTISIKSKDQH